MPLVRSSLSIFAVTALSLGALVTAQVVPLSTPQTRDTQPPQPAERRVPVGSASISGTVVSSDTGRPVRGAQVRLTGQIAANAALASAPRGAGAPASVSVAIGARGGTPVQMTGAASVSRMVVTDASGEFSFPRLPAGQFTVAVFQNQFLQTSYGQRRPGGQGAVLQLADGQQMKLRVPMSRGAVISGVVMGPDGEPQRSAQVRAWRHDMSSGFKRLSSTGFAQTDDRGIYRMFGLQPGDYVVSATPNPSDTISAERTAAQADVVERAIVTGQILPPSAPGLPPTVAVPNVTQAPADFMTQPTYLATYAPSSLLPSGATTISVGGGEERTGVDIVVQFTQASTVQGVVATPLDPGVTVQLSLVSDEGTIDSPQAISARPDNTGKFTFRTVAPGKYTVFAQTVTAPNVTIVNGQSVQQGPPPVLHDAQKMWGKTQITVAGEPLIAVNVVLQPSRSISGVVVFEMAKPPDLRGSRLSVTIGPAPSPQPVYFSAPTQALVGPDGRFTLAGVSPGRYVIRANGGQMKSSVVGGQDTLDFPIDFTGDRDVTDAVVTLTDQVSELSGTLTDSTGKPVPDHMILVIASDSRYWLPGSRRIAMSRPGPDGRYLIRALPPGSYMVAAVFDLEPGAQFDAEFLRTVARASVPAMMSEGGKVTQDLRVK